MYCVCVAVDSDNSAAMLEVQNLYGSPPSLRRRDIALRHRKVPLVDLRGPREVSDLGNVQSRTPGSAMRSEAPTDSPFSGKAVAKEKKQSGDKEWRGHRSQGVHLRAPGDMEVGECFGILPIADVSENKSQSTSIKVKKMTRIYDGSTKFPKLEECAHFHYDLTELGPIQVSLNDENQENLYRSTDGEHPDPHFYVRITSNNKSWTIRRNYENFRMFDKQLHRCIFDRKYSLLPELKRGEPREDNIQGLRRLLEDYLNRFSTISDNMINCGPVLSWLEMDNRGNRLIVTDDSAINTPAIAAAHVVKRYTANAGDEISFEVGDIISIIDMPPPDETVWWRGKRGFEVGFFPSECVEVIGDKVPPEMASKIPETPPKPVLRKRGKLISFLRMFFTTRPTRTTLKRTGIVKERVFGCDLGEHLLNSGHDVPMVLKCCAEVIESHGIVDGIYRLSGVASNIQKLRVEFDEDQMPDLQSETYLQDIHSISSLLKMYFRELPNPLFTYQLYDKFAAAVQDEENRLTKLHDVVQQLPPPHYRTAEYLIRHLARVAAYGVKTGMHFKNLAIVWAPNLLRSKELETSCNVAALQGVGVQAVVTEYLIMYCDIIFSDKMPSFSATSHNGTPKKTRPKSLAVSTPTKLLSLEEARERALVTASSAASPKQKYIDVGGGPDSLPTKYHTVLDWPHKKKSHRKGGKSPVVSGWRSLFTRGRTHEWRTKQKYALQPPSNVAPLRLTSTNEHPLTEEDLAQRRKLRTVKSADSLLAVSMQPNGKPMETSVSATVDSSYANRPGTHARKPSGASAVTVQSEGGMRPLTKRSISYDMYYSESDMEAADMSPSEDGVFMTRSYTDADSHSSHSGWSGQGAVAMETSDPSYSRMADLEGRFYFHQQRHQRHLSDSDSVKSQGSYSRGAVAVGYIPSKSPTFKSFDSSSTTRSQRGYDGSKSPRLYGGSKSPRSLDGSRQYRGDMRARAVEAHDEDYYDAVSQILGTKGQSVSSGPSPSSQCGPMLTTFQPLPMPDMSSSTSTMTTSTSVPLGLSSDPDQVSSSCWDQKVCPPSPSLRDRIVKALSPPSIRKKMRSPSPSSEDPHSPVSSPPVAKSRKSRSKGTGASVSPPLSPAADALSDKQDMDHDLGQSGVRNNVHPDGLQETHFDVNPSPQAKQLSPIGELLPVVLSASPGSRRKNIDVSPYDAISPEEALAVNKELPRSPRLHPPVQPSGDELLKSLYQEHHIEGIVPGDVSDYDNDMLEASPPVPPPRKRRSGEIPITPGNEQYLSELETAERMLAALGSPQNRMSKALSVPSDLERSRDTLDSMADMCSIGSFNELSKSLDSLLNGVATHHHTQKQHKANTQRELPDNYNGAGDQSNSAAKQKEWSPEQYKNICQEPDLQFDMETSPMTPNMEVVSKSPVGIYIKETAKGTAVLDHSMVKEVQLDADVGASSDYDNIPDTRVEYQSVEQQQSRANARPKDLSLYTVGQKHPVLNSQQQVSHYETTDSCITRSPGTAVETASISPSKRAQAIQGTEPTDAELSPAMLYQNQPKSNPTSPIDQVSPKHVQVSHSPGVKSPVGLPAEAQITAEMRRTDWVNAPKASMEDTHIDKDSPPVERRSMGEEADDALSSEGQHPAIYNSEEKLDYEEIEIEKESATGNLEMLVSISPNSPVSASHLDADRSPQFAGQLLTPEGPDIVEHEDLLSPCSSVDIKGGSKEGSFCASPEEEDEEKGGMSVDVSMEEEVFTMDMDESCDNLEAVQEKKAEGKEHGEPDNERHLEQSDIKPPEEQEQIGSLPTPPSPMDISSDFGSMDTGIEKCPSKPDNIVERTLPPPVQSTSPSGQTEVKEMEVSPVASMKYMSRSYGGEHQSREETPEDSSRSRSYSGERKPATQSGQSPKTPPAVMAKKFRLDKKQKVSAGTGPVAEKVRVSPKIVPRVQAQEEAAMDSDESASVKYDDDRVEGRKKRHSPKRQKSVKELLSRFETLSGSPPKEAEPVVAKPTEEPKFRPAVFQKPKIVHLNALSPPSPRKAVSADVSKEVRHSPVPAPRKINRREETESPSPRPSPRTRQRGEEVQPDKPLMAPTRAKSTSPVPILSTQSSCRSENGDSDDSDKNQASSEESSQRKVRKLSLIFERRNSTRSDSLEPPIPVERRKRCDSARSDSSSEPIREENGKSDANDSLQKKCQNESNNEKISKQEDKPEECQNEKSLEKENVSVRHLSQMFERARTSRSPSSEPGENGSGPRGQDQSRYQKTSPPWTAIV